MMAAALAANHNFLTFDVCMLQTTGRWEFVPHPTMPPLKIRPGTIGGIVDARVGIGHETTGIRCSLISGPVGSLFVIGSPDEIERQINEAQP